MWYIFQNMAFFANMQSSSSPVASRTACSIACIVHVVTKPLTDLYNQHVRGNTANSPRTVTGTLWLCGQFLMCVGTGRQYQSIIAIIVLLLLLDGALGWAAAHSVYLTDVCRQFILWRCVPLHQRTALPPWEDRFTINGRELSAGCGRAQTTLAKARA